MQDHPSVYAFKKVAIFWGSIASAGILAVGFAIGHFIQ
jgi:hypothetical protein